MNITHVVENLNRGGLERMVLDLVRVQQAEGHRCQVLCLFEPGTLASELDGTGIPVHALRKRRGLDARALADLRRHIKAHATEVIHTHNAVAHYLAVLATLGLPFRSIVNTRHGMGALRRATRRETLYKLALMRTRAVAAVCEAARQDAVRRGILRPAKAVVVPNGIRIEAYVPASSEMRDRLLQTLQLPVRTYIIGSVGRLNQLKDQTTLIRAFREVHTQRSDTALVLVGDGELRDELQRQANEEGLTDHVRFLGDRSDVPELLQGLDVFALSSISEGYSMALLEACAAALPIIATDVGGNREIVHDGESGLLVPAQNPGALATALVALLDDPSLAARLGRAGRTWVELHGSIQAMAKRYLALYQGSGAQA